MNAEAMILADGSESIVVHFLRQGRIACMPGLTDFASGKFRQMPHIRTDEVRSVTCTLCKKTNDYLEAGKELSRVLGKLKIK